MLRIAGSMIAGYFTMGLLILLVFSVALIAPDFAFQQGTRDVTTAWMIYTMMASFLAALIGGYVAVLLGKNRWAGLILSAFVFLFGIVSAIQNESRRAEIRPPFDPNETIAVRGANAVQPTGYAFTLPVLGALGALVGTRLRPKK